MIFFNKKNLLLFGSMIKGERIECFPFLVGFLQEAISLICFDGFVLKLILFSLSPPPAVDSLG